MADHTSTPASRSGIHSMRTQQTPLFRLLTCTGTLEPTETKWASTPALSVHSIVCTSFRIDVSGSIFEEVRNLVLLFEVQRSTLLPGTHAVASTISISVPRLSTERDLYQRREQVILKAQSETRLLIRWRGESCFQPK